MGTSLCAITNVQLSGKETEKDYDAILQKLKDANFEQYAKRTSNGGHWEVPSPWNYNIIEPCDDWPFHVNFDGSYNFTPTLYTHIAEIHTMYRLGAIYENYQNDYFPKFREDLYKVMRIIGGTEVIFLCDNSVDVLNDFLDLVGEDQITYEVIKAGLIERLGPATTDYRLLKHTDLGHRHITQFMLDDFRDFKL